MNKIDKLIKALCPEGVPHERLSEVGTLTRGKRFVKEDMRTSGVPCIHYGEIYTKYGLQAVESFSFLDAELASKLRTAKNGDVIIASAGETVEDIGKSVAWLGKSEVVVHDACYIFRSPLDPEYSSYFFATDSFRSQIRKYISSSKVSAVSTENMGKALIPVPPPEIQKEIVSILKKLTELGAELEAELEAEQEARALQFRNYRDQYYEELSSGPVSPLGEVGEFIRGGGLEKKNLVSHGFPAIHYGQIHMHYGTSAHVTKSFVDKSLANRLKKAQHGNLVITTTSENLEDVCTAVVWLGQGEVAVGGETYIFKHGLDPLYVAYFFQSHFFRSAIRPYITGTKVKRVSRAVMERIVVPVPSLDAQVKIGLQLKALDDLTSDINAGIPPEITARRQQYEHYRNRLLTFKELKAS
jgi:type I restriction enzyme S subunit